MLVPALGFSRTEPITHNLVYTYRYNLREPVPHNKLRTVLEGIGSNDWVGKRGNPQPAV